ncbi:MAG: hypothetical protein WAL72_33030 [Streptosporangiaceae bacterium]
MLDQDPAALDPLLDERGGVIERGDADDSLPNGRKGERRSMSEAGYADQLAAVVKNRVKRIQHRPALIGGFLAQTGLTLEPGPP